MNLDDVVEYIKGEGCRVRIYPSKEYVHGGSVGTFDYFYKNGPLIVLATATLDIQRTVETLLHEFGHYLQWRDGFMQALDGVCDAYSLEEKWLNRKIELSPIEIRMARNVMLAMEFDAERRGVEQGRLLGVDDFNERHYIQGAQAYLDAIKWTWMRRQGFDSTPSRIFYSGILPTHGEVIAALTEDEISFLDRELGASSQNLVVSK